MMMGSAPNTQQTQNSGDSKTSTSSSGNKQTKEGSTTSGGNPQGFNPIAAAESLSLILQYEAIAETIYIVVKKFSKYAHNKLGIPYPLNIVVVLMFCFVVLYTAQKVRMALC